MLTRSHQTGAEFGTHNHHVFNLKTTCLPPCIFSCVVRFFRFFVFLSREVMRYTGATTFAAITLLLVLLIRLLLILFGRLLMVLSGRLLLILLGRLLLVLLGRLLQLLFGRLLQLLLMGWWGIAKQIEYKYTYIYILCHLGGQVAVLWHFLHIC